MTRTEVTKDELDFFVSFFRQSMEEFETAVDLREEIRSLMNGEAFRKAYSELGHPLYFDNYRPVRASDIKEPMWTVNILETLEIHRLLTEALHDNNAGLWEELKSDVVADVLVHLRHNVSYLCVVMHNLDIPDLIETARRAGRMEDKRKALLRLVELDNNFLRAPFAGRILARTDIESERDFRIALSKSLAPKHLASLLKKHRQKRALEILLAFGYKDRSYSTWTAFFKHYNSVLKDMGEADKGFYSYENSDTIRRAIKSFRIPKKNLKGGRLPGHSKS